MIALSMATSLAVTARFVLWLAPVRGCYFCFNGYVIGPVGSA